MLELKTKDWSFGTELLREMKNLCDNGQLYDIVLIAGMDGQRYHCIRAILASSSQFFRAMFTSSMSESKQSEITLQEVSGEQLKPLLDFCYTGKMDVLEDEDITAVKKLLCTASLLQLDAALVVCVDYLMQNLTPANCLGIFALADQYSLYKLQDEAEEYICENFVDVCQHDDFLQMPFEQLVFLITSDHLNVPTEETVFDKSMCWVQYDALSRQQHIPELLKQIRLPLLPLKFLKSKVRAICMENDCVQLFSNVLTWKTMPAAPIELSRQQISPRLGSKYTELLAVSSINDCIIIKIYNPIKDDWRFCGQFDLRIDFAAVFLNESLIIAGGWNDDFETLNTVLSFDLRENIPKNLCPMQTTREIFGLAVLENMLYAVGGENNHDLTLNSVERYDPVANTWRFVAPMKYPRNLPGVAVLDGLLYAVGGQNKNIYLNSTECYNPETDEWTQRANMNSQRSAHGVAAARGFLYAIAGWHNNDYDGGLNTLERYDPRSNQWTQLCSLPNLRGPMRCALLGQRLLAYSYYTFDSRINEYNFEKNTWSNWRNLNTMLHLQLMSIPKLKTVNN